LTAHHQRRQKSTSQTSLAPGRDQPGTVGDIMSVQMGDIVGIRNQGPLIGDMAAARAE